MKKVVFLGLFVFSITLAFGQHKFGLKGGINPSLWVIKEEGQKDDELKTRVGFHAGLVTDLEISKNFSIQPQLLYVNKGSNIEHEDHTDHAVIHSIDIPVNLLYKAPAGSGKFFIGGGPNFGFNLKGTLRSDEDGDEKIEIGGDPGQTKAFDFGLNFLAGYELNSGLFFSANYTPGISNLENVMGNMDVTKRSTYFGISVGYFFNARGISKK